MSAVSVGHLESIRALADILIPRGGTLAPSASEAGVPERIQRWIDVSSPPMQRRFRLLLAGWDLGPLTALGYLKPFHRLDPERQAKWVEATHHSKRLDRRMPVTYLKQLIFLAYASSPQIEEALGFDYTCRLDGEPHARLEKVSEVES